MEGGVAGETGVVMEEEVEGDADGVVLRVVVAGATVHGDGGGDGAGDGVGVVGDGDGWEVSDGDTGVVPVAEVEGDVDVLLEGAGRVAVGGEHGGVALEVGVHCGEAAVGFDAGVVLVFLRGYLVGEWAGHVLLADDLNLVNEAGLLSWGCGLKFFLQGREGLLDLVVEGLLELIGFGLDAETGILGGWRRWVVGVFLDALVEEASLLGDLTV